MSSRSAARRRGAVPGTLFVVLAAGVTVPSTQEPSSSIRLAWDANADGAVGYVVHVGTQSRVYAERYDVGDATSFTYLHGLPGQRYYFAVSAYDADGNTSPHSNQVSAVISRRRPRAPPPPVPPECPELDSGDCAAVGMNMSAADAVTGAAALPDERVLLVEGGRRVRLLSIHGMSDTLPLNAVDDDELTEIVVDPAYHRTALVFVGAVGRAHGDSRTFRIVRYRLVGDALGEGATIVGNLAFRGDHAPRFTIDDAGLVYVAMPGAGEASRDAYAGRLLRFAADGTVPHDNRAGSPVVAESLAIPLDLDWDGAVLWVTGREAHGQFTLARLAPEVDDGTWPRQLERVDFGWPADFEPAAFDVSQRRPEPSAAQHVVIVDADRRAYLATVPDERRSASLRPARLAGDTQALDAVISARGTAFVVVHTATGIGVLELTVER